jgi:CheY-like chemotaxis protein
VLEDEGALRRTATRVLERAGSRVLSAEDGRAGLELWRQYGAEITVVLSDQDMPEMTGLELLNEARRSGGSTPFVLTTGHAPPELRLRGEVEGELVLLPKPWRVEELNGAGRQSGFAVPNRSYRGWTRSPAVANL